MKGAERFFRDPRSSPNILHSSPPKPKATIGDRFRSRYSFICQGTSTRRQRRDLFSHRVKLPHNKRTCRPSPH